MPTSSTSMPNAPLDPSQWEALAVELRLIDEAARRHTGGHPALLARPIPSLDPQAWQHFAKTHDLSHWMVLSPGGEASALAALAQHMEELRQQRYQDPLTGLPNRGAFDAALALELERTRRTGAPVSLAILDIDDFKRLNDTAGHPAGDAVLRAVAQVLRTTTRRLDLVARLGGEEFAIILPATSRSRAVAMVERVLAAVRTTAIPWEDTVLQVTISAGVASARGREPVEAAALYVEADQALYAAKRAGKDRVFAGTELGRGSEEAALVRQDEKRFLFRK